MLNLIIFNSISYFCFNTELFTSFPLISLISSPSSQELLNSQFQKWSKQWGNHQKTHLFRWEKSPWNQSVLHGTFGRRCSHAASNFSCSIGLLGMASWANFWPANDGSKTGKTWWFYWHSNGGCANKNRGFTHLNDGITNINSDITIKTLEIDHDWPADLWSKQHQKPRKIGWLT